MESEKVESVEISIKIWYNINTKRFVLYIWIIVIYEFRLQKKGKYLCWQSFKSGYIRMPNGWFLKIPRLFLLEIQFRSSLILALYICISRMKNMIRGKQNILANWLSLSSPHIAKSIWSSVGWMNRLTMCRQ